MSIIKPVLALAFLFLLMGIPAIAAGDMAEQPLSLKDDAGKLYVGYDSGKIRVFDSFTLQLLETFDAGIMHLFSLETDKNNIYYGTDQNITRPARTFSITKAGELVTYKDNNDIVLSMKIADGRLYTCLRNGMIRIFSTPDLALLGSINNSGLCRSVRVDEKYIYATSAEKIGVWNRTSLKEIRTIDAHTDVVRALWDDASNLYSVADDNTFKIWSKTDFSLKKEDALMHPWAMAGDGSNIYATSDRSIAVMNKNENTEAALRTPGEAISAFALHVSGNKLYAAYQDGTVRIWDTTTFQNTVTSGIFTIGNEQSQLITIATYAFYALLVAGVAGFIATSLYERRKKKTTVAIPPAPPAPDTTIPTQG